MAALGVATLGGFLLAAAFARAIADPAAAVAFGRDAGLAAGWSITLTSAGFAVPAIGLLTVGAAVVGLCRRGPGSEPGRTTLPGWGQHARLRIHGLPWWSRQCGDRDERRLLLGGRRVLGRSADRHAPRRARRGLGHVRARPDLGGGCRRRHDLMAASAWTIADADAPRCSRSRSRHRSGSDCSWASTARSPHRSSCASAHRCSSPSTT